MLIRSLVDQYQDFLILRESEEIEEKIFEFKNYITNNLKTNTVHDELVDFFDLKKGRPTRWCAFRRYIQRKYPIEKYQKVLDVGSGTFADLSKELVSRGYIVTAMDPKIEEIEEIEEIETINSYFDYKSTDISDYDLVVGLEPCDATEHIIRCAITNNKAFCISLCGVPHDGIDGTKFKCLKDWIKYLKDIDSSIVFEEKRILEKNMNIIHSKI